MAISISCPGQNSTVLVSNGAICACGNVGSNDAVVVGVLRGWVSCPTTPSGTSASVGGGFWFASGVGIPALGADNKMTVCVWQTMPGGSGSGGTTVVSSTVSQCYAGSGSGAVDCCQACADYGARQGLIAEVLVQEEELVVDVPSGVNAGTYRAVAVGSLTWEVKMGETAHRVAVCGGKLVLRRPSGAVAADDVELEPFSATFAGDLFGSDDDVVLTIP